MFRKLLVPLDFAQPSLHALELAKGLLPEGGTLRLLYVLDEAAVVPMHGVFDLSRVESRAAEEIEKLADGIRAGGVTVETSLRRGHVANEIAAEVAGWGAEALIVGSHGRKGLTRLLMGSTAERLVRESEVPIGVVKGEPGPVRSIALASDFSDSSQPAFEVFCDYAKGLGVPGHLLHALDEDAWMLQASMIATSVPLDLGPVEQKARDDLAALAARAKAAGVTCEAELLEGSPWELIEDYTRKHDVGMLVLGTHGYRGYERFVLGSVAQKLLRTVSAPVLVVPAPRHG
ncbi:MAG: universal stress protein [Planctomycetota bacterium]